MSSTGRRVAVIAAWTAAAVLGVGAVAGAATSIAFAADPTPTPSSSATATPDADRGDRAGKGERHGLHRGRLAHLGGRALHGEFVIKDEDGKFVTMLSQRGEVTAVDDDSITLKSEDGFTKTYSVNADTKIRRNHDQAKIGDVKVGDNAGVVAVKDGDSATARTVIAHAPGDD